MNKRRSKPFNPNIANGFFRAGLIETWGRGIEKICEACKEAENPLPEYTVYPEDIMVMFQIHKNRYMLNRYSGGLTYKEKEDFSSAKLIQYLEEHPFGLQKEMVEELHISLRTIQRIMAKLQENDCIEREGGKRKGKWKVRKRYDES